MTALDHPSLFEDVAPLELLERLKTDGNLIHSGARWRAHAAAYPNVNPADALELAASYATRDAAKVVELRALHADLLEKAPDDDLVGYCEWAIRLLDLTGTPDA